ncbi:MAG TPA: transketolase [Chitinophagaceae bacterium]|nr:transketolase [Chitinophagaceae bacterium]
MSDLKAIAGQIRRDIIRMVYDAQSGHPGGSLGCTEFFTALYFEIMDRKAGFTMDGTGEDLFFLSNGHISPVWYSTLARAGYFPVDELKTFRKINSRLQGHPTTHEGLPGIRVASGSLGQGMSVAIGAALAKKLDKDDHTIYSLHGDGELDEGQNWEAIMFAAHHKVDNLIATIDWNGQQIDGPTKKVMSLDNLHAKFDAFNWQVLEMDGNEMDLVIAGLNNAKTYLGKGKPIVILMKTEMGYGIDFMKGNFEWHGVAPNDEQLKVALAQLPVTLGDY